MIRIVSVTALLLSPATLSAQVDDEASLVRDLEGSMRCEVKSDTVTAIEDGVPQMYSGLSGSFGVGDSLVLTYRADASYSSPGEYAGFLAVSLRDDTRDQPHFSYGGWVERCDDLCVTHWDDAPGDRNPPWHSVDIVFRDSFMRATDLFDRLYLSRYYRGDWDGIFSTSFPDGTIRVVTLDCRPIEDNVNEVISALISGYERIVDEERAQE